MSKTIISIIAVALIAGGGLFLFGNNGKNTGTEAETPIFQPQDGDKSVIAMESKSFSFSPGTLQARAGETVRIDITSTGRHTFTIDELGVNVITPHGKTTRVEFTPERAGVFQFYCAIPGHREAGQVGTITVE